MNKQFKNTAIKYHRAKLPQILDETEQRLIDQSVPLFQSKGRLVRVIRLDDAAEDAGIRRPAGALVIHTPNDHLLLETIARPVKFATWNARREQWVENLPPLEFAKHFNARGTWKLRVLRGIVEAPTLRADGTVLSKPGYDDASGIWLDTGGVEFPEIPESPTRKDALHALDRLKDVIKDFPFVPDDEAGELGDPSSHRSVALSAILTGVCRKALRTAPGHGFDATSMATGKTLLCDVVSIIATGRPTSAISQGKSEEEFDKRLFSILLQGDPVIVIDNIDRPVRSDEFCTVLTAEEWQCRVLGISGNKTVPTNVLFLLNGNGLQFEGDIRTRVIMCHLDAGVENPGARKFDRDLRTYVPEHRPQLVAAALTVLRAFVVAGRPGVEDLDAFGRFEDWSNLVRGALVWLGEPDPCATREALDAIDPERDNLAALMRAWLKVIGTEKWVTAKQVIDAAQPDFGDSVDAIDNDLDEALLTLFPRFKTTKTVGRYLTKYKGRIVDGMRIQLHAVKGESTEYRLELVDEPD
ncbi:MAG: hypothetical protein H6874_09405 [Hyphomicrobiaceae bacterium]|nr:hypothetical protein [Hyphomicrobiaceae bacterium]